MTTTPSILAAQVYSLMSPGSHASIPYEELKAITVSLAQEVGIATGEHMHPEAPSWLALCTIVRLAIEQGQRRATQAPASPSPAPVSAPATAAARSRSDRTSRCTDHANALRDHALRTLATRGPLTVVDLRATYTSLQTTLGALAWIVKTLLDRGHVKCAGRGTRHTALTYEITPAGREYLAAQPTASAVIPPNAGVIADPATH